MSKLIETVILADFIMEDFNKRGVAADFAYYELLEKTQEYVTGHVSTDYFHDYLGMIFGIGSKARFLRIRKKAEDHYKYIESIMDGTWNPDDEAV